MSAKPTCSTSQVSGRQGLHSETIFKKREGRYFSFNYVYVFGYLWVCTHECRYLWSPEEGLRRPGAGVTASFGQVDVDVG